jgi:UDP-N-acetylmuramyl-tripeptide synthetase
LAVWSYALHRPARLQAVRVQVVPTGIQLDVVERASAAGLAQASAPVCGEVSMTLPLMGEFNASNVLCVMGALRALGISLADAAQACGTLTPVPGRMQWVKPDEDTPGHADTPLLVVDYAHTPDALHKALLALRPVAKARGGRLWCVFGCGGDRDATKRPLMGAMADQYADEVVLTNDNPRFETPRVILSQILMGITRSAPVAVIEQRQEAIEHAVSQSAPQDVILLAGKGHETTQEVAGVKTPFSDVDVARQALQQRRAA